MRSYAVIYLNAILLLILAGPATSQAVLAAPEPIDRSALEIFLTLNADRHHIDRFDDYLRQLKTEHQRFLNSVRPADLLADELILTGGTTMPEMEQAWLTRQHYAILLRSTAKSFVTSLVGPAADGFELVAGVSGILDPGPAVSRQDVANAIINECSGAATRCQYVNQGMRVVFGSDLAGAETLGRGNEERLSKGLPAGSRPNAAVESAIDSEQPDAPAAPVPDLSPEQLRTFVDEAIRAQQSQVEMGDAIQGFRLVAWVAGTSGDRDLAVFAGASASALADFAQLAAASNMSNFATGMAAGLITANWIGAVAGMLQPDPQMEALGAIAEMIGALNRQMHQRFDRVEELMFEYHKDEVQRIEGLRKLAVAIKVDTSTITNLLLQETTLGFKMERLGDAVDGLARQLDESEIRQRVVALQQAAFKLRVVDAALKDAVAEEFVTTLGSFVVVVTAQPPFVVSAEQDVHKGLLRVANSPSLAEALNSVARVLPHLVMLSEGPSASYVNLVNYLQAVPAIDELGARSDIQWTATDRRVVQELYKSGKELSSAVAWLSTPRVAERYFQDASTRYRKVAEALTDHIELRLKAFDAQESAGVNFMQVGLPRAAMIKALEKRFKNTRVPFCGDDNKKSEGDFPVKVFKFLDDRALAAELFGVSETTWCLTWRSGNYVAQSSPGKNLYELIGRMQGTTFFDGGVIAPADQTIVRHSAKKIAAGWNKYGRREFGVGEDPRVVLHDAYFSYYEKWFSPSGENPDPKAVKQLYDFRDNCYFLKDPAIYEARDCAARIGWYGPLIGPQFVRNGKAPFAPFLEMNNGPLFEAAWRRTEDFIVSVCRSRIVYIRDLQRDAAVSGLVSKLDEIAGEIVGMAALVADGGAGMELFLTGGLPADRLVTGNRFNSYIEGEGEEVKQFERGLPISGVCPVDQLADILHAANVTADLVESRLPKKVSPWLAEQIAATAERLSPLK